MVSSSKLILFSSAILFLIGAIFLGGGLYLLLLGGSPYYLITGAILTTAAVFYLRGKGLGERLYSLLLIGTLVWALIEAGTNPWALTARLFAPAVLGLWLALPAIRRRLDGAMPGFWRNEPAITALLALAILFAAFVNFQHQADAAPSQPAATDDLAKAPDPRDTDWANYGNQLNGQRYARLSQINAQDVDALEVAWVHRRSDHQDGSRVYPSVVQILPGKSQTEATPIKVGDILYSCDAAGNIYAIAAASGKEIWRNGTGIDIGKYRYFTCRGVSFYHKPSGSGPCTNRIIAAGMGGFLWAVDATTGELCRDFGHAGRVSLFDGLGKVDPTQYKTTSPVTIVGDLIVVGALITDNFDIDMPSGVIRAFDASTGALRWAWDMGSPDRVGAPPLGQTYTRSTPNAWGAFSADAKLGLVYVSTGNASPDFYGLHRRPFDEKYGDSLVALNVSDGRPRWSFQTTHHDLWDYDVSAQPVLVDVPTARGPVPAVLQPTKRGDIFVLDRRNGHPVVPVHEVKAPAGAMPGERLSATQPVSGMSFIPPRLSEREMWGATPIDQMLCRIAFRRARNDGIFTPPGLRMTLVYSGQTGGIDWSSVSVDDDRKIVFANPSYSPWEARFIPREQVPNADNTLWPQRHTPYVVHNTVFMGPLTIPCKQPPWGTLAAIDLKTNHILWEKVVGTARDTGPFGMSVGLPLLIGTPSLGGTVATRGGVIFMAATLDRYLRAFDARTGRELWKARLPAGAQATPMTYMAGGKQYVVIVAGGHAGLGTKEGDYTIAYALPDRKGS